VLEAPHRLETDLLRLLGERHDVLGAARTDVYGDETDLHAYLRGEGAA
jgi:hypothetical protein